MFKWHRSREIDDFAISLAREFSRRYPPEAEPNKEPRSLAAMARAIDEVCNRAKAFQREKRLGMYGRAKLGTSFKLELKQAGYAETLIDDLTRQLLLIMSGK